MPDAMDQLQEFVLRDSVLRERLLEMTDRHLFACSLAEVAEKLHLPVAVDDIEATLDAARRRWLDTWV